MASKSETAAITRALLALVSAIDAIDDALVELVTSQDHQRVREHVTVSREARNQCLEEIQRLLILMDGGHE